MTSDTTTLIQAFAKRLVKSQIPQGQPETGNPAARMDSDLTSHTGRESHQEEHVCDVVHPGLSHSQYSITESKQDMTAYSGGAAPIFGQGQKLLTYDGFSKKWVEQRDTVQIQKSLDGVWCDWCHQGPFNRYVPYRGQKVCVKCMNEDGPSRRPISK